MDKAHLCYAVVILKKFKTAVEGQSKEKNKDATPSSDS